MGTESVACYLIHYHAPDWCRSSAESLQATVGVEVDVAIVDNGGWTGPRPQGARFLELDVNKGFTGAANAAIADWWRSGDEFLIVGAHDLHLTPDSIDRMIDAAQKCPEYGILTPVMAGTSIGPRAADGDCPDSPVASFEWVAGACMLLRRSLLVEIGGFDESFGSYTEDRDICWRARHAGWRVGVVRDAAGYGLGKASSGAYMMQFRNGVLFNWKHRGAWNTLKSWAWLLIAAAKESLLSLSRDGAEAERLRGRATDRVRAFFAAPGVVAGAWRSGPRVPRF